MWRRHRNTRRADTGSAVSIPSELERAVVDEACAVVGGLAMDIYLAHGRPVPEWVWLNALARRSPNQLGELVGAVALDPRAESWVAVTMEIAAELSHVEASEAAAIQAALFVPFELEVLAGRTLSGGPYQLVRAIRRRLAEDGPGPTSESNR